MLSTDFMQSLTEYILKKKTTKIRSSLQLVNLQVETFFEGFKLCSISNENRLPFNDFKLGLYPDQWKLEKISSTFPKNTLRIWDICFEQKFGKFH